MRKLDSLVLQSCLLYTSPRRKQRGIRDFSFGDQGAPALDRQGAGAVYGIVFRIVKNNSVTFKSHPKGGVLNLIGINQQEIR